MGNPFDEMADAVHSAHLTLRAADSQATRMAGVLQGRLRCVCNTDTLCALKKEIHDFNMNTMEWKSG